MRPKLIAAATALTLTFGLGSAVAGITPPQLKVNNGRFEPATLTVDANSPTTLRVVNSGDSAIEFESFELNRERVVPPGQVVTVFLPSLGAGTYHFFDDFHRDAGQGTLIAK